MTELTDEQVFGAAPPAREMSDADVFGPKGVKVPDHIPDAFLRRFSAEPDPSEKLAAVAGPNLAQRVLGAIYEGGAAGYGEGAVGLSPENIKKLQNVGIFRNPDKPVPVVSGIQFMNESAILPLSGAIEATFRGINSVVYAAGAAVGQVMAEVTGANEAEAARARRDGAQLAMVATLLAGGQPVSRKVRGPTGEVITEPIGTIARSDDFVHAAQVVAGDNPLVPAAGMVRLYRGERDWGPYPNDLYKPRAQFWSEDLATAKQYGEPRYIDVSPQDLAVNFTRDVHGHFQARDGGFEYHGMAQKLPPDSPTFGGEAPMYVQEKLLRAYQERGIHPSELAHDAMSDPIVAQRLLSSDKGVLPDGGAPPEPPRPPKAPAEPPAPPPEGSFEAAQKTILDKISVGEAAPKERMTWAKFYRQAIDDLHPLKKVDEGAYELARLTRGQFGKAEHFIEHGTFDFNTYKTNGKPLREILEPVAKDMDGFRAYLASKRALEIEASGRKSGMDIDAATRVAAEGEGAYGKAAADLQKYQENLLAYLRDSGVISPDAFNAMREAGQNYVPFYRVFEADTGGGGTKGFGPASPVKKLKGSERVVVDPLESIVKNTYAFVSVAERNAVGIKLIDALKAEGEKVTTTKAPRDADLIQYLKESGVTEPEKLADFVNSAKVDDGTTLSAWRDGKRETVKVNDPELVTAFRNLDQQSASLVARMLAPPAKWLRTGATLSPDFIARNIARDFLTAFVNTGRGMFTPVDTAKGLVGVIRKDADFQNWMKGGGANATMVALDRRYMQESLHKLNAETGLMERSWNVVTTPYRALRMASELAENATRLGEFKKMVGEGGKESIQSAAFASREVTLDFARVGASMRGANMAVAFLNAQLQGLDRVGRAFIDRPVNTLAKVAAGITLPSVLLWYANKDDQRYKDLPHWQKDLFWIVMTKDHIYRIPKPFELGVVFGSGAERILDATVGKNPEAMEKFGKAIWDIVTPSVTPTAFQPLVEQWANRSTMSDRTLIPKGMEDKLPEYQYTPYTTELSKKLGQVVSAIPKVRDEAVGPGAMFGPAARATTSPILIENYVRGWSGGLGVYAMQAADAALRKAGVLPDPVGPTPTLADIPVVKAFVVRYPSATTQSIQDFYDKHEVAKKFYDTWLSKAKEGDADAMSRIQAAGGPLMFVRLDAIKETLLDHNKLVRDIHKNPTIKPEEKRQLIDGLYFNMIEIGKGGKAMVTEAEKALGKAADAAP